MTTFEDYIRKFDYPSIPAMKMSSKRLIELLPSDTLQVIDIRFKEEYEIWNSGLFKNIPINELPDRLDELEKDKIIVLVCPNNIRSNVAMHYLMTKGFNVKFLADGLLTTFNSLLLESEADNLYQLLNR